MFQLGQASSKLGNQTTNPSYRSTLMQANTNDLLGSVLTKRKESIVARQSKNRH